MSLTLNKPKLDNLADDIWKSAERLRGKFKAYEYQTQVSEQLKDTLSNEATGCCRHKSSVRRYIGHELKDENAIRGRRPTTVVTFYTCSLGITSLFSTNRCITLTG